uniref:Putative salivary lipocalin n=1 Tax=Amblyomma parvum TaxID=251391 RepID=A0A023G106_AMBPA
MTRITAFSVVVLLFALHLCNEARFAEAYPEKQPFEEAKKNFRYHNVLEAISITGRVYVVMRNYNISTQFLCLYSKRVKAYNETQSNWLLELQHLPDGSTSDPPKLHKLMYINKQRSCLIFVENRKSAREDARCQLMQPAAFAGGRIPLECLYVFNDNCPGSTVTIYRPLCKQLRVLPPK